MNRDVRPFFVAADDSVQLGRWEIFTDRQEWESLEPALASWDYNTNLIVRRSVAIDVDAVRDSAQLPASAGLAWSVSWRARDSSLSSLLGEVVSAEDETTIEIRLDASELGAAVDLITRLVLTTEIREPSPGVACKVGSILYEDVQRLDLLGSMAQFPVSVIDFHAAGLDPDASFVLELDDDPRTPLLGGALLMINARDADLVRAATTAGAPSGLSSVLVSGLSEEVYRTLIEYATAPERADLLDEGDFDDESIGRTVLMLAARSERVGGLEGLRRLRSEDPVRFVAAVIGEARRQGVGRVLQ